jgi:chromosome segregation ATPase
VSAWREKFEAAQAANALAAGEAEATEQAGAAAATAQARLREVEKDLEEATARQAELARKLSKVGAEHQAELDGARAKIEKDLGEKLARELTEKLAAEYQQKLAAARAEAAQTAQAAQAAGQDAGAAVATEVAALKDAVRTLELQRDELGADLLAAQDALKKAKEEAAVARASVDAELNHLRVRVEKLDAANLKLEGENKKLKEQVSAARAQATAAADNQAAANPNSAAMAKTHRDRLLRQARTVRAYRKQVSETKSSLEASREEIATQREQLRLRKENLEQVKRLLEKQEMVMARKLADHNALKTVAAVGIFVIMILGSTFFGVYKFVNPVYGSEALVRVAPPPPPAGPSGAEATVWLNKQAEAVRSEGVTFEAWKKLRSDEVKYGGHEGREEWLASLDKNLSVKVDPGTKTLSIQYDAPSAEGAAQVCNALAGAYVAQAVAAKADAGELAKAFPKDTPKKDKRLMTALTVTAALLLVSLVAVMLGRYYVRRQLREIDRMADEADLEDVKEDMPAEAKTA